MFKRRIGITQKVFVHPDYDETMECLDRRWHKTLTEMGILSIPLPIMDGSQISDFIGSLNLDGIILSGGNSIHQIAKQEDINTLSPERDLFENHLLSYAFEKDLPVLGVCRGAQLINVYFGGMISKIDGHIGTYHGIVSDIIDGELYLPQTVNSYHNFAIKESHLANSLKSIARDFEGNIEAFTHLSGLRVTGVMWHPERELPLHEADVKLINRIFSND